MKPLWLKVWANYIFLSAFTDIDRPLCIVVFIVVAPIAPVCLVFGTPPRLLLFAGNIPRLSCCSFSRPYRYELLKAYFLVFQGAASLLLIFAVIGDSFF